jgi:cellulose synthase operon protein C
VEAQFYTAMARKAAGDAGADERLRAVSKSPVIDLLEVHLAREMLAPTLHLDLPRNAVLP